MNIQYKMLFFTFLTYLCFPSYSSERWYQDPNLRSAGDVPIDFESRMNDIASWKDTLETMDVYYLRSNSYYRHLANNPELKHELSRLFDEYNIKLALDDADAVWAHSPIKGKDPKYRRSIAAIMDLESFGFDVAFVGLQSVLSKPLYDSSGNLVNYPMSDRFLDVSEYFKTVGEAFPHIQIGIIDALASKVSIAETKSTYSSLKSHLRSLGYSLSFIHIDIPMDFPREGRKGLSFSKLIDLERYIEILGMNSGLFVVDTSGMESAQAFSDNSIQGLDTFLELGGSVNHYIMSSWYHFPKFSTPDRILTSPPSMMSVFRNMDRTLNFYGYDNNKNCYNDVRRVFDGSNHDVSFSGYKGSGSLGGVVFRAYCGSDSSMRPLYNCKNPNGNTFVSKRYDCEGKTKNYPHLIGYVNRNKTSSSSKTIYRCRSNPSNHFVSNKLSECSQYFYGGILGYTDFP